MNISLTNKNLKWLSGFQVSGFKVSGLRDWFLSLKHHFKINNRPRKPETLKPET